MDVRTVKLTFGTPESITPASVLFEKQPKVETVDAAAAKEIAFSVSKRGVKLVFPLGEKTRIYGFGLQLNGFDHRGNKIVCRVNADPQSASGDSHAPVPFFVTNEGWGMYVDTARNAVFQCGSELNLAGQSENKTAESRVMTSTSELYAARASAKSVMTLEVPFAQGVDIYVFLGERIVDIVSAYNRFSGGGCMPPMWGLGNFYRCFSKYTEDEVLSMADSFREKGLPCDILGLEPGWQTQSYSCSYLWSERFPHHEKTLEKLTEKGFKVNLWEHAFVHPTSPLYEELKSLSGDYLVWNGLVPDFALEKARESFAAYHRRLCDEGILGYKLDECDGSDFTGGWSFPDLAAFPSGMDGEQYHHLFGTLYAKTMLGAMGSKRTLSQVRNLGALAAPYPFVLYSDLYSFENFLCGTVNSGFSGLLWSPEVRHAENKDDLIRRLQLVSFSVQSQVNAWYLDTMPWIPLDATEEVREILENRMRLLPYLYTAFYDYYTRGIPPVRALVCDYPAAEEVKDEFLFGDMVVAPIAPGKTSRKVWLPEGEWFGFFDGKRYLGGEHEIKTDGIPVYVKSGTVIPVAEVLPYIAEDSVITVSLKEFGNCENSVCRLIEDDGVNCDADYRVLTVGKNAFPESKRYRFVP